MQRPDLKILLAFSLFIFSASLNVCAQISNFRLKTADSLYNANRYTQSLEHYQEILKQNQYSPAMLLKMAYIQEGLNNIGQALYYLNLYQLATNDKEVLQKMEELAEKHNLEGYDATDADRAFTFYHDFYEKITLTLSALVVLFLSMMFYSRMKLKVKPVVSGVFFLIFLSALFLHINIGDRVNTGILTSDVYIMNGPSAGANLVEIASGGHKVEVLGSKDVWVKIRWNGEVAYVRKTSVLPIVL